MLCTPSTSTFVVLVASAALLSQQAEALPTHRSSSAVTRRAHIANHHSSQNQNSNHGLRRSPDGVTSLSGRAKRTSLGDHSVVVDASTSSTVPGSSGGIKNSTINLTVIAKRDAARSSTFSSFARVVRSLFGRGPSAPSSAPYPVAPVRLLARNGPSTPYTHGERKSRRSHQAAAASVSKRSSVPAIGPLSGTHKHPQNAKNQRRAQNYTDAVAQASVYASAIAQLDHTSAPAPEATASPVVHNAKANNTLPSSPSPLERSPVTLTVTLVPSGVDGAYIDAAGLPTPSASALSASSARPAWATASASPSNAGFARRVRRRSSSPQQPSTLKALHARRILPKNGKLATRQQQQQQKLAARNIHAGLTWTKISEH
ncbi:hypothetical protein JCM1841_004440 [Sporobolomyces salmonicolor]